MSNWQQEHERAIHSFLKHLNKSSGLFVLKGDTSLLTCYKLDRFSEDIDLDGIGKNIEEIVGEFCNRNGYSYRVAKDTDSVKRYMINYGNVQKPLKVEVSFRRKEISADEVITINGLLTYKIDVLCGMKMNAYAGRDQLRDLYDLSFICKHYFDNLSPQTISVLRGTIEHKGIEQFDYLAKYQPDELVDEGKLALDFLAMFDKLGLLYNEKERQIIDTYRKPEKTSDEPLSIKEQMQIASEESKRLNENRSSRAMNNRHREVER